MKTEEEIREGYEFERNKYIRGDYGGRDIRNYKERDPIMDERLDYAEWILDIPEEDSWRIPDNWEKYAAMAGW